MGEILLRFAEGTYREVTANPQVVAAYLGTEEGLHA